MNRRAALGRVGGSMREEGKGGKGRNETVNKEGRRNKGRSAGERE